jgi:quinol monooxygenase YgiN
MICFTVTFEFEKSYWKRVRDLLRELTRHTRAEPGNLMYLAHQSQSDQRKFFLYEQYKDEAALEAHRGSDHFARYATNGLYKLMTSRTIEFFDPIQ